MGNQGVTRKSSPAKILIRTTPAVGLPCRFWRPWSSIYFPDPAQRFFNLRESFFAQKNVDILTQERIVQNASERIYAVIFIQVVDVVQKLVQMCVVHFP